MRNFFFLILALSLFTFASCGGDDDTDAVELTRENIAGNWNLTVFDNDADVTVTGFGSSTVDSEIANSNAVVSFTESGTWSSTGEFDITIVTQDTTTTETITDGIGSGTYVITNGQLSMTGIDAGDEADTETPTVFTVSDFQLNTLLELTGTASESGTDPFFGLMFSTNVRTKMVLER